MGKCNLLKLKLLNLNSLFVGCLLLFQGCTAIGPQTISRDRFDYAAAISDSWKKQMLLNMVRIRYADTPVFLEVASIINQYSVEGEVYLGSTWFPSVSTDSANVGASGKYSDRPTITYKPLLGAKFTRSLMTPIPPSALFSLIQAGWPVEFVMRSCMQSVNGLYNRAGSQMMKRPGDPEFYEFLKLMGRIQSSGAVDMRVDERGEKDTYLMFFRRKDVDASILKDMERVGELLGLDRDTNEFELAYGAVPKNKQEIAVLSRSVFQIIIELASYIDIPEIHLAEKRATQALTDINKEDYALRPLICIHAREEKPKDAFVSVKYHEYWFWIDDKDLGSKQLFSFLMILFTLSETGGFRDAPIVTVPAG